MSKPPRLTKAVFRDGAVLVNPPAELFDPFLQRPEDEKGITLYRFRPLDNLTRRKDEIHNLVYNGRVWVSPIAQQNDDFEGLPYIPEGIEALTEAEKTKIKLYAYDAINNSSGIAPIYAELARIFSTGKLLTLAAFDAFAGHYFEDPIFLYGASGDRGAIEEAATKVREWTRIISFSIIQPNSYYWGHYAKNGVGICYELEDRYEKHHYTPLTPQPVIYADERPRLSAFDVLVAYIFLQLVRNWDLTDASFLGQEPIFFNSIAAFAFRKEAKIWAQESEARLIDFSGSKGGYIKRPGIALRRVIMGPRCGASEISSIRDILNNVDPSIPIAISTRGQGYDFEIHDIT